MDRVLTLHLRVSIHSSTTFAVEDAWAIRTTSSTGSKVERLKAVDFGFGQSRALSEHTASKPAMPLFVKGEATVKLGDEMKEAQPGTWIHMPAGLKTITRYVTPFYLIAYLQSLTGSPELTRQRGPAPAI